MTVNRHDGRDRKLRVIEMTGGVHQPPAVGDEPVCTLVRWRMIEVDGQRHCVGWSLEDGEGRVSSPVVTWDSASRSGVTRSGRRYVLCGDPGRDADADYVLGCWLKRNGWTRADMQTALE